MLMLLLILSSLNLVETKQRFSVHLLCFFYVYNTDKFDDSINVFPFCRGLNCLSYHVSIKLIFEKLVLN